jgi:hypothetical protein
MTTSSHQSAWNLLYSRIKDGVLEYGAMAQTARLFWNFYHCNGPFLKLLTIKLTSQPLLLTLLSLRETERRVGGFPSGIEQI